MLATSYRAETFADHFGDGSDARAGDRVRRRGRAAGHRGGIRNVADRLRADDVLVFNGDVLSGATWRRCVATHRGDADVTLHLVRVEDPRAFGSVPTDADGRVQAFLEKTDEPLTDQINAGCYVFRRTVLETIPAGRPVSVERETFPGLLAGRARVFGHVDSTYWLDLGTPADVRPRLRRPGDRDRADRGAARADRARRWCCPAPGRPDARARRRHDRRRGTCTSAPARGWTARCCSTARGSSDGPAVTRSVVGPPARVDRRRRGCVEDAVVGDRAVVGRRTRAAPGPRVWPGRGAAAARDPVLGGGQGRRAAAGSSGGRAAAVGTGPPLTTARGRERATAVRERRPAVPAASRPASPPRCAAAAATRPGPPRRDGAVWRAGPTRTARRRPAGPPGRRHVVMHAWGPGAEWSLAGVPDLLGDRDDPASFVPRRPLVADAARRQPGLGCCATGRVWDVLVPAILEQKVTGTEARQAWRVLFRRYGNPAPGPAPAGLRHPAPPAADPGRARLGVAPGGRRLSGRRAILACAAVAHRLENACTLGGEAGRELLRASPGSGCGPRPRPRSGPGRPGRASRRRLPHPRPGRLGAARPPDRRRQMLQVLARTPRSGRGRCGTWSCPGSASRVSARGSPARLPRDVIDRHILVL